MVYKRKQQTFAVQKQASTQALKEGMEVAADTQISMKPFRNVNALPFFFVLLIQNLITSLGGPKWYDFTHSKGAFMKKTI